MRTLKKLTVKVTCLVLLSTLILTATSQETVNSEWNTSHGRTAKLRLSVKSLDLSRAPSTEELMAAGQLGGLLYATHELKDQRREEAARWDFGHAIEQWNRHEYPKAVAMFREHMKKFPDSPWAAEAELHVGCDGTYNGRYTEAESIFRKLIADHQGKEHEGAQMLVGKARQRLGLLKVEQNNLPEASVLFTDLLQSPDWRLQTYASHWIQRISRLKGAQQALLSCGNDALAYLLEKEGRKAEAGQLRTNYPSTMRGHTLVDLVNLAAMHGYELSAIEADGADLSHMPLPAVLHISSKNGGDSGHYWVLDKVQGDRVELFDPQSQRRFQQAVSELVQEWSGRALVFAKGHVPGRRLDLREMEANSGGCCGAPRPPDNTGDPCQSGNSSGDGCSGCSQGSPQWSVNTVNMNLYVTDTPLWYDSAIGPSVQITLSYNSQSSITHYEPFGNKWQFNYVSYLTVDTSGSVLLYMPDGRYDVFSPDGTGGYRRPYRVFNTLTRIANNHFELRFPDDTVYVYRIPHPSSLQAFLTEIRDAHNHSITFGYSIFGFDPMIYLTGITNAQGKVFTLSYAPTLIGGYVCTNVTDPFGRSARFEYDVNRNLTKITDMGGYWSSFTYHPNVYLSSLSDARGTTQFWIEPSGPAGYPPNNSDEYPFPGDFYMWENYRITITDPLGQKEEYFYYAGCDQDGYGCSGYTWHVRPRDYISWKSKTENNYRSRAPKTRYRPDRVTQLGGQLAEVISPKGDYVQYAYDSNGKRTAVKDAHGHITRSSYNDLGNVTSMTDAKGTPTAFVYAANQVDLLTISNGLGQVRMTYNGQHDLLSVTDRLTNTVTFNYNTYGQILFAIDALNITNQYLYGSDQRLSEVRRAGQTLERFTYDTVGRVRTHTDTTGLTRTYDYSPLNQVVRVTYPDSRFESYTYSSCCPRLLDSMTDRAGRTTYFTYDALKRLIRTEHPEGITRFGYDANGNHTNLIDPNGNITTFIYDLNNRLAGKTYADGRGDSFSYDHAGLLTNRSNARGITTTYTYDTNHNLLTTSYSDGTPGVARTYDAFDRIVTVRDGMGTNVYGYDANSRLTSFDGPWANDTITYMYDPLGRRTNLLVQGSPASGYGYDTLNRLTAVRVGTQAHTYTYPGASPFVQRLDRPNGSFTTYGYDNLNRLTNLSNRSPGGGVINAFSYAYNQDLRSSETVSNGLALTFTNQSASYSYNNLNQMFSSGQGNQVFAYDDEGNMIQGLTPDGHVFSADYDAENRLKRITFTNALGSVHQTDYDYSYTSFMSQRSDYDNGVLSALIRYVRDGVLVSQERDTNNTVQRELAWGLHLGGGIGGLLRLSQGSQNHSLLYDGRGNTTALLDGGGALAARYAYDSFGLPLATNGSLVQPYQFSTKHYDPGSGLSYFGYRFYMPVCGRWLNRDPIVEQGGLNLYGYARNDPINAVDATGQSFTDIFDWQEWDLTAAGNFAAGFGDVVSFGGTTLFNEWTGANHFVDESSTAYTLGEATGYVHAFVSGTAATLKVGAKIGGTRFGHILNHNRHIRIGPGRWGRIMVDRISIGNGPPGCWNHWRL